MTEEEANKQLNKSLQDWWDSDTFKQLQKSQEEGLQKAVGKYFMLSEEDKLDMVQAILYIMCKAEKEGISHRGVMDELGIYPAGFWISELMDCHNALYEYYDKRKQKQELEQDIETLKSFLEDKDK